MCDPVKRARVQLLDNAQSSICEAQGGSSFTTTATICPPPDASFANYCDHFSKGLGDPYWQKQGNLDVTFEVFHRRTDQDFANVKRDLKQYAALQVDYRKAVRRNGYVYITWRGFLMRKTLGGMEKHNNHKKLTKNTKNSVIHSFWSVVSKMIFLLHSILLDSNKNSIIYIFSSVSNYFGWKLSKKDFSTIFLCINSLFVLVFEHNIVLLEKYISQVKKTSFY